MSTRSVILSIIQKGGKKDADMNKAFDNANEVAAKANDTGKKKK